MLQIRRAGMTKPLFLYWLYNSLGDYYLAVSGKDNQGHKWFSKWVRYSTLMSMDMDALIPDTTFTAQAFLAKCCHRSIFDCEILFDFDYGHPFKTIKEKAIRAREGLILEGYQPVLHFSGSRGYHISCIDHYLRDTSHALREAQKRRIIRRYDAEEGKAISKCFIALEGEPHWKTGIWKDEVLG